MKRRSLLLIAVVFGFAVLYAAGTVLAGTVAQDTMILKPVDPNSKYKDRTVTFSHKKHHEEYKLGCGECHHDDKGKPLANLKAGDNVKLCIECHKQPGEAPKGKDAPKLDKKEKLAYNAEAFHQNCVECHKEHAKKTKSKEAPTSCTKCHQK